MLLYMAIGHLMSIRKSQMARFITRILAGVRRDLRLANIKMTNALPTHPTTEIRQYRAAIIRKVLDLGGSNCSQKGFTLAM